MDTQLKEKIDNIFSRRLVEALGKDVNILILAKYDEEVDNEDGLGYSVVRLREECKKSGIPCFVAMAEKVQMKKTKKGYDVSNIGEKETVEITPKNTVVMIREHHSLSNLDLITQLERNGFFCVNTRECNEVCKDKFQTILKLVDGGLTCPKSVILRNEENIDFAVKELGGKFPLIIKTLDGSQGVGVFMAESEKSLKPTLQTIWKLNPDVELLMQQKIDADFDVRVHVLNGKVIASMRRDVMKGDFRSNYSQGAKVGEYKLSDELAKQCIAANDIVGGTWTGVDFMLSKKGEPYFIEVNASPGTEGVEKATGKNIINEVIEVITNKNNWKKPKEI